jgi:CTP:molybdopterin cytidylyltransferase MocA
MTVGAVVVAAGAEEALADAAGRVAARRIVDVAWAGGALPIVIVVDDDDGRVAAALDGSPAYLVPAIARAEPPVAGGTVRDDGAVWRAGAVAALEAVVGTTALLLWPANMTWIDPETVTSLIEAHGRAAGEVLRPQRAGQNGWPVLVPAGMVLSLLAAPGPPGLEERLAGLAISRVELGDPGSVLGSEVDLHELPDYAGPPEPVGGPPPEWGAAAADTPDPEVTFDPEVTPGPS